jgi:Dockerin type I domain
MAEQNQHPEEESLQAPEKLVEAMNLLQKGRIFVPPTVDHAVLREAREHVRRLEGSQSGWKPWLSWAAMAACLALAVWLGERFNNPTWARPFAREDINRDGHVDVLDAFALARRIDTGGPLDPHWDINGDGRVDRADVNAIAACAVRLAQAGPEPKRSADLSPHRAGAITVWRTEVRAPFFGVAGLRANLLSASCRQLLSASRSAELYSAVSQSCTLPTGGKRRRVGSIPRPADCMSAIRQIENLRYKTSARRAVNLYSSRLVLPATWSQHAAEEREGRS